MYSECPKFHPNWFTSCGVIAERVNTVQTHDKVNPTLYSFSPSNNDKCHSKSLTMFPAEWAYYTVSQKMSHLWLAVTLTHVNRFWYFLAEIYHDKVSNQKMVYYATSNNLCTTLQNAETWKLHFSLKCCISALPEFNQLLDFFNLFDSQLILTVLYDSLSLVINVFIFLSFLSSPNFSSCRLDVYHVSTHNVALLQI